MATFNLLYARDDDSQKDPAKINFIPINQNPNIGVIGVTPNTQIPGIGIIAIPGTGTTGNTGTVQLPDWLIPPSSNPTDSLANQIKQNLNSMMYIENQDGERFWYFPTGVTGSTVNGYRWNQQAGWFNYSMPLSSIKNVYLYNS